MKKVAISRSFIFVALTAALASSISLIGGFGLEYVSDRILPLAPLIIAIPGLNDLVGDYASIIAAHSGDPNERQRSKKDLAAAIFKVIGVNIAAIVALSLGTAAFRGFEFQEGFVVRFVIFIAVSAAVTVAFMFFVTHTLQVILERRRINPDELLIPVITSVADIVMLLLVTLAVITIF